VRTLSSGLAAFFACAAITAWGAGGPPGAAAGRGAPRDEPGPFTCRVTFPSDRTGQAEPLLSVGTGGAGDIIFVHYHSAGRISLGWEQPGWGVVYSDPIEIASGQPHRLLIALGSLIPAGNGSPRSSSPEYAALRDTALVQFDGRTVLMAHGSFQPFHPGHCVVGANVVGGAVAGAFFSGQITDLTPVEPRAALAGASELTSFLGPTAVDGPAGLQGPQGMGGYPGPVLIRLRFPRGRAGQSEPLIVTGATGAGDIVYVHYDTDHQLRFGFDHWRVGGPTSEPVEIDPDRTQEIVVSLGSMLPPVTPGKPDAYANLRDRCLVFCNGRQVLKGSSDFYPARPAQIFAAINPIGGSTAGPKFSGVIIRAESVRPEDMPGAAP
jgi:hypothetical protein